MVTDTMGTCKDFEVTNLLWACAQLVKHRSSDSTPNRSSSMAQVEAQLPVLMHGVEIYFQGRLHAVKSQILVSALVSVATLSSLDNLCLTMLFQSICDALALKSGELSFNNKTQVGVAGQIMAKYREEVVKAVSHSFAGKCPELASYFAQFPVPQHATVF